jgi:Ran GTPase-activating protein (RanGAP) involved in mRNA processing and transport
VSRIATELAGIKHDQFLSSIAFELDRKSTHRQPLHHKQRPHMPPHHNHLIHNESALFLRSKCLDDEQAIQLARELTTSANLTYLNLNDNAIGNDGALALASSLSKNRMLTRIDLDDNRIGDSGVAAIATMLRENTTLTVLRVNGNRIGHVGAYAIANALKTNDSVTALGMGRNLIGSTGAAAIADALKSNKSLSVLGLEDNRIGNRGAAAFGLTLKQNSSLSSLSFGGNRIGLVGVSSFAEALTENQGLTVVWLDSSSIDNDGAAILAESLKSNGVLTGLDLNYNNIGDDGATAMLEALRKYNSTLTRIDLMGNTKISPAIVSCIEAIVTANEAGTRSIVHQVMSRSESPTRQGDLSSATSQRDARASPKREPLSPVDSEEKTPSQRSPKRKVMRAMGATLLPDMPLEIHQGTSSAGFGDNDAEWMARLPTQRVELEFEVQRLTAVREACKDTTDREKWNAGMEAEKRIHFIRHAISSGKYPTLNELEMKVSDVKHALEEKIENDLLAAAIPLRDRLEHLEHCLALEREAEARLLEVVNKHTDEDFILVGRRALFSALQSKNPSEIVNQIPMDYLAAITNDWKDKVGSGGFGTVYKGHDSKSGVEVAVKTISSDRLDESEKENFTKEMEVRHLHSERVEAPSNRLPLPPFHVLFVIPDLV